ncbi:MAG: hypothetical protein HY084_05845 [Gemmatimonadetes bacterium]|nr:hypothetical protein [Gemmatimonadota bacterium]
MFVNLLLAATLAGASPNAPTAAPVSASGRVTGEALAAMVARARVPSFSRQTRLACSACHTGFPQLNSFGRLFKLNGYTMTGLESIIAQKDSASRKELQLSPIAPLSMMAVIGATSVATAVPGTQSVTAEFPQQLSLFGAAAISPRMGIFSQVTYSDRSGTFGIDNTDLRYAGHGNWASHDVIYGMTLNNNPSVQDVWNTVPAWNVPFMASAIAPMPMASTKIEGAFSQQVLGLGAYAMFDGTLYAELSGYVPAKQGVALPLDSSATDTPKGVMPYWRVALQHQFESTYLMVGAFGMAANVYPTGINGAWNKHTDVGVDAQIEHKVGEGTLIGRATYIHEDQTLTASAAASPVTAQNLTNTLSTYKANISWVPSNTHTLTVGYFGVNGSSDNVLYAEGATTGSATGSPNSSGFILDANANAWMNVRFGAQYVAYQKFNGGTTSYDVATGGRKASDNNTLYLYLWLAF